MFGGAPVARCERPGNSRASQDGTIGRGHDALPQRSLTCRSSDPHRSLTLANFGRGESSNLFALARCDELAASAQRCHPMIQVWVVTNISARNLTETDI